MEQIVSILGTRGSVPVSGPSYSRYGGATTCVLVRMGGEVLLLDAGTGILSLPEKAMRQPRLSLLLSHPHADHLLGFPMCPYMMRRGGRLDVYAARRGGLSAREQVCALMAPPLWPVGPEALSCELRFHDLPEFLRMGDVRVNVTEGGHPGGVSVFRVEAEGKSIVFATDCELNERISPRLAEFARGCDLLLFDGQYSEEEWPRCAGFGHSSWSAAAQFAQQCGARRLRVIHHAPFRTDKELDRMSERLCGIDPAFGFAREGEEIRL